MSFFRLNRHPVFQVCPGAAFNPEWRRNFRNSSKNMVLKLLTGISQTIQVRQTIFSAFERRQLSLSFRFLNCWVWGPLARRHDACKNSPHWLQTLRQNFARSVSLTAFQNVSKHARASHFDPFLSSVV